MEIHDVCGRDGHQRRVSMSDKLLAERRDAACRRRREARPRRQLPYALVPETCEHRGERAALEQGGDDGGFATAIGQDRAEVIRSG